jgi:hypothetical protein
MGTSPAPYTPAWTAKFIKPLQSQGIAIFQRDSASALAVVNADRAMVGNAPLPPINDYHIGPILDAQPPCLFAEWTTVAFSRPDEFTRKSTGRIEFALTVPDTDPQMGVEDAGDYARMMDIVLTTASGPDWITPLAIDLETLPNGTTNPNTASQVTDVFVESHTLMRRQQEESETPSVAVHVSVLFEVEET